MELPKDKRALGEIFKTAETPNPSEFQGEYFVDMLTALPSLRKLNHRKIFYQENGRTFGCNVILKNKKWGRFFVEQTGGESGRLETIINYGVPENSFISKNIRDQIRRVESGLYIGRFNYILFGKPRFLGYFSLIKK